MLRQDIYITVDCLVFSKCEANLQLLLIKRKNEPSKGMWAFPGGFVDAGEELEAAAIRELEEETGMALADIKQLHTFGKVGRDTRFRTISVVYYAVADSREHKVAGGDDACDAQWVNIKDITGLAFDHMEILEFALQQLKVELLIS
jgi:8-oxo-dGTP diphosphatase